MQNGTQYVHVAVKLCAIGYTRDTLGPNKVLVNLDNVIFLKSIFIASILRYVNEGMNHRLYILYRSLTTYRL